MDQLKPESIKKMLEEEYLTLLYELTGCSSDTLTWYQGRMAELGSTAMKLGFTIPYGLPQFQKAVKVDFQKHEMES